jgi:hypothetical protein
MYCVLSLPIGLCLYGLNVARRGGRIVGYALAGLSSALLIGTPFSNSPDFAGFSFLLPGVFVGIGLLNLEDRPYRAALSHGGLTARWWPPLIWAVGLIIAAFMLMGSLVYGKAGR